MGSQNQNSHICKDRARIYFPPSPRSPPSLPLPPLQQDGSIEVGAVVFLKVGVVVEAILGARVAAVKATRRNSSNSIGSDVDFQR